MRNSKWYISTNYYLFIAAVLLLLSLSACEYLVPKKGESSNDEVVVQIDNYALYQSELDKLKYTDKDSSKVINNYIENWIHRHLMLIHAENNIDMKATGIEKKVENFRYELIVYEYKKKYINSKLNRDISDKEIKDYYDKNTKDFELRFNIIRCNFIKIPLEAPKLTKAKRWFYSGKTDDYNKLKDYAYANATDHLFDDSSWFRFDEIVQNTPLIGIPNKTNYLKMNKYIESSDTNYLYLLKINEYKLSEDTSPLEFVKDNIQNIILNKRRAKLIEELENKIYSDKENKNMVQRF